MRRQVATLDVLPPSTNNLHATAGYGPSRHRFKTAEYKAWITYALAEVKRQLRPVVAYPVDVTIWIFGGQGFNVRRDSANFEKPITDLLVRAKVLRDDSTPYVWDSCQRFRPAIEPNVKPSIVITVTEGIDADWRTEAQAA